MGERKVALTIHEEVPRLQSIVTLAPFQFYALVGSKE
jgi:hypothetical protein